MISLGEMMSWGVLGIFLEEIERDGDKLVDVRMMMRCIVTCQVV